MTHRCIEETNELLKEHNAVLSVAIDFSGKGRELVQLSTAKLDSKVRRKPPSIFASYCPFCGKALKGMT